MFTTKAYSAGGKSAALAQTTIQRRDLSEHDVQIDIRYCGACHTDLHQVRDEWHGVVPTVYPCVPGHEIVGEVVAVGSAVQGLRVGENVAVGCLVESDGVCSACEAGLEQLCPQAVFTFNSPDRHLGGVTFGGYSESIVVDERFVLQIPGGLDLASTAPLLCAGITTYSALRDWGDLRDKTVGIVGIGGLGHIAVQLARALGAHVVALTRSPWKGEDALRFGAHEFISTAQSGALQKRAGSFDFVLDTVSGAHDIVSVINLLGFRGKLTFVGGYDGNMEIPPFSMTRWRRSLSGSAIGGIAETREMLAFCAQHRIAPEIEIIPIQQINDAYDRLLRADVKYRFVIDMASLRG